VPTRKESKLLLGDGKLSVVPTFTQSERSGIKKKNAPHMRGSDDSGGRDLPPRQFSLFTIASLDGDRTTIRGGRVVMRSTRIRALSLKKARGPKKCCSRGAELAEKKEGEGDHGRMPPASLWKFSLTFGGGRGGS